MNRCLLALLCLVMLTSWKPGSVRADAGLARHQKLYAVPREKPVKIDGRLDDWDLSGQIFMYVMQETSDMQSARFALMYDDQALYVSGVVRDPSPMMNRHDPKVDADKGWDADACQFRIATDPKLGYPWSSTSFDKNSHKPDQPQHLLLWYYTDRKEPALQIHKSMAFVSPDPSWPLGAVPGDKFEGAYLKADDGGGYTFEYRIPWSTLGAKDKPPKAGDVVPGTVQFNWSTPDGMKTAGGSAWAYDVMAGPGFPYQSTLCWGKIIFSEKGRLPKEIVEEGIAPEKPMPLSFTYEMPEDGQATVQLFRDDGVVMRTLIASAERRAGKNVESWDGLDANGSPLPAGNYAWKGLYHKGIKTKFILSVHNSGQPPYKLDDNTGGWGGDHGTPTNVCAVGDDVVLTWNYCESGWGIIRVDVATGKKKWGIKHNASHIATDGKRLFVAGDQGYSDENSVKIFSAEDGRPLGWGNGKPALAAPPDGDEKTNIATGVAYSDGMVYVSWGKRNVIMRYDATSGEPLDAIPASNPRALASNAKGVVVGISGGIGLMRVTKSSKELIGDGTVNSRGVAVEANGTIYVATGGNDQNVAVYDADGKYLRSIGKKGGRPALGRYDKSGMLEPGGIAVDSKGKLWVAETLDSPKRHSVWDTQSGALAKEYFGGSAYFGWAYMDPKHPDEIYCHNTMFKVDLDKGTWEPYLTMWRPTKENQPVPITADGYAGHVRAITAKNGKQFAWGQADYCPMLFMRDGDVFKPIAGMLRIAGGQYGNAPHPVMADKTKFPEGAYFWQDYNDDQTIQVDEVTRWPEGRGEGAFNWIDTELNAWCDYGFILKPVRFEASGKPVYDFSKREPYTTYSFADKKQMPFDGGNSNGTSLILDESDQSFYTLQPGRYIGFGRWKRDGTLMWGHMGVLTWHNALSLPMVAPGRLWGLTMPLGVAGDFTGAACYFGPYHIFTRDGLYVAMVMRDGRSGGLGPDITAAETIMGQLVKPDGMNRYFLLAGDQDGRVTEILGLENVKRLPGGEYRHTDEMLKKVIDARTDYERLVARSRRLDIVRGLPAIQVARGVGKTIDPSRSFIARAAHDEKNLYVLYEVTSPNALTNEFADVQQVFKGGNAIDIQLATNASADPKRKTPVAGDVRLVVTRQKEKTVAVLYRPRIADFKGHPIVFTSPTGKEPFDAIEVTDKVELKYEPGQGRFKAMVTIPHTVLNWSPKPGEEVRLDLGYIFGNTTGTQAAARAYWCNNSFSSNVTNDLPNESRLEPAEWGAASIE